MTFLDFFAGIGGFRVGMEQAGHKCIGFCEFDKFATMSYTSMHLITEEQRAYLATLPMKERQKEILKEKYRNGEWYSNDIRRVTGRNVPKADCWCFGAPCFVAGTLITTHRGLVPIEQVCIGDYVLTHKNRFKRVVNTMINYKNDIYALKVQGSPKTECTGNHRFFVRYAKRVWNNAIRRYEIVFSEPEWKQIKDFTGKEYIQFPCNTNSSNVKGLSEQECYLLGRYTADGYLQEYDRKGRDTKCRRTVFCIGTYKQDEFIDKTKDIKFTVDKSNKSCYKFITLDKRLFGLCKIIGRSADSKYIPQFIMDLPTELLACFIDGYMSGDGCFTNGTYSACSVSKTLIYQLGQAIFKVYNVPFSIYKSNVSGMRTLEGRTVNQKDNYIIRFNKEIKKQNKARIVDGDLYMPVKRIEHFSRKKDFVYNLEVEDDNSYTANLLGVHNCQSFSVAGKRAGLDGASGLIREVFRILSELKETDRPEWLIYENVKGMLTSSRGFDFLAILLEMGGQWVRYRMVYFQQQVSRSTPEQGARVHCRTS